MKILMLGNSFTYYNDMPQMLAKLTGATVVANTKGGARLAEQLNEETELGSKAMEALRTESWDYVVLQEQSNAPITSHDSFLKSSSELCKKIRENGAVPVFYATWAYQKGGQHLAEFGMDYDEMYRGMYAAYHEAAELNHALIADVGKRFYEYDGEENLYVEDSYHPSEFGSRLAAEVIAEVLV